MVSYRSARKLSSYLVTVKLYPTERKAALCKCKVTAVGCVIRMIKLLNKIYHKFDCNEKRLVYLITCNNCLKQYVGETVNMFRSRWTSYKDNSSKLDRGEDCMQRHLFEYFQLPVHTVFLQDTYVTLIDKTNPRATNKRKDYWIYTLKTKAPMGLNVEGTLMFYSY